MKNTNNMTFDEILEIIVEDLELAIRTYNCLKRAGSRTVGDIIVFSEDDFLNMRNFGARSIEEIKDKLKSLDPRLHLGMTKEEIHDLSIQYVADNLNQEEKEELEKMENYAKQKAAEALKAEYMVTKAQGYYDTSSKAIQRKQAALAELQKLSQEQERLQKESEQLDAQIASLAKSLGLENFENNSEMVNNEEHVRK